LIAETDILPATNGSARICFSDGTEAIVGVKAEVEKTLSSPITHGRNGEDNTDTNVVEGDETINKSKQVIKKAKGSDSWVEVVVEMPGFRDDDQLPVFLSLMLSEAILADGTLRDRLYINSRFHWVLYVDASIAKNNNSDHGIDCTTDIASLCSSVISITVTFVNHTSCFVTNSASSIDLGAGRRSTF